MTISQSVYTTIRRIEANRELYERTFAEFSKKALANQIYWYSRAPEVNFVIPAPGTKKQMSYLRTLTLQAHEDSVEWILSILIIKREGIDQFRWEFRLTGKASGNSVVYEGGTSGLSKGIELKALKRIAKIAEIRSSDTREEVKRRWLRKLVTQ